MTKNQRKIRVSFILVSLILFTLFGSQSVAYGATITVTTTADVVADDGLCSLREAIIAANTNSPSGSTLGECVAGTLGTDTIVLANAIYTLTGVSGEDNSLTGDLDILPSAGPVEIEGVAGGSTTINGGGVDRVIHIIGATVEIRNVTITGGSVTGNGGGIYNEAGTLTLNNSVVTGNAAVGVGDGGGIYNRFGTTNIINSTVSNNTAANNGGGIFSVYSDQNDQLTISLSTIVNNTAANHGGGIHTQDDGGLLIVDTTIINNHAPSGRGGGIHSVNNVVGAAPPYSINTSVITNNDAQNGAGIFLQNITNATINYTEISDNVAALAGGGIYNRTLSGSAITTLTLIDTTIDNNNANNGNGGGLLNIVDGAGSNGRVFVITSTVSRNTASLSGGGIYNASNAGSSIATLNINTSTISTNTAVNGGGIQTINTSTGTTTVPITSSTIANNNATNGDGIRSGANSTVTVRNTILHNPGVGNVNCEVVGGGLITSSDFNIDSDGSCAFSAPDDQMVNPLLQPLAASLGQPTETHNLANTSPAIDNGDCPGAGADQRGYPRPIDLNDVLFPNTPDNDGDGCDIGAVEVQDPNQAIVSGRAWEDIDGDGIQDIGEPGIAGVTVQLFDSSSVLVSTDVTDGAGNYEFIVTTVPAQYFVQFTAPVGHAFTLKDVPTTTDDRDSDVNPTPPALGATNLFLVTGGSVQNFWDAGLYRPAQIGNFVWNDLNGNGVQNVGEPGLQGVLVTLHWSGPDTIFGTGDDATFLTATNASGNYSFTNAAPGRYFVNFDLTPLVLPYVFTFEDVGANDNVDSDANPATGNTGVFTLISGQIRNDVDAGAFLPSSVGDFVWDDLNGNGIQEVGEPGLAGVTVNLIGPGPDGLLGNGDDYFDTMLTDGSGNYTFTNVPPGNYQVQFVPLLGYTLTVQNATTDDLDSDPDPVTGLTASFFLAQNTDIDHVDAGMFLGGTIGDRVHEDLDGDGILDVGEPGVGGVTINLRGAGPDNTFGTGDDLFRATVTSAIPPIGAYSFTGLPSGLYELEIILPTGYVLSELNNPLAPDTNSDNDFAPATRRTAILTLAPGQVYADIDALIHLESTITGYVWNDTNGNGAQELGETGRNGVTVNLYDATGTVLIQTTVTATNVFLSIDGYYEFTGLAAGTYIVEVVPPAGFGFSPQDNTVPPNDAIDSDVNQFSGRSDPITLTPDDTADIDAGVVPALRIGNFVWSDLNGNGIQNVGEPGLAGITVNLYNNTMTLLASTTTNAAGNYGFVAPAGNYTIEVILPLAGYTFSPQDQGANDAVDSDVDPLTGQVSFTLTADNLTIDAGMVPTITVTGFVWQDTGAIGVQDGESGEPGVTVHLIDAADGSTILFTDVTDAGGNYAFINVPAQNYILQVVPPPGFGFSPQDAAIPDNDAIDSDVNQFTGRYDIVGTPGSSFDIDAGLLASFVVGDQVWLDTNDNDIKEVGEPGINGVTINLYNSTGLTLLATTTTTTVGINDGIYSFFVQAGQTYVIEVIRPAGYLFVLQDVGVDDTIDSDVDPITGRVTVGPIVANDDTIDAGLEATATIAGIVWNDTDANGIRTGGEAGLNGVTVNLLDNALVQIDTTVTAGGGLYSFENLTAGDYTIEVVLLAGHIFSPQDQGVDDTVDSDVDVVTGRTAVLSVSGTNSELNTDAGMYQPASIGDFVWQDLDADGIQDVGEPGLDGVTVNLLDTAFTLLDTTVTAGGGLYSFNALAAGSYVIEFVAPPAYSFTLANQGANDNIDSDADQITGRTTTITIIAGQQDNRWDAGLTTGTIGNFVWEDLNGNGLQDVGEPGIDGVTVNLLDTGFVLLDTTVTAGGGQYLFTTLPAGSYVIEVVALGGYNFTTPNVGVDDTIDSDTDPLTGRTGTITLASGQSNITVDSGLYRFATITGFVWEDLDGDGIQDGGELGIDGIAVTLLDGTNAVVDTTATAGGGLYTFTNVVPGSYRIEVTLPTPPPTYTFSPMDAGGNDNLDSDIDPLTGRTALLAIASNATIDIDAGMYAFGTIGDLVWLDLDQDGIQDVGEPGQNGVTVNLYNFNGTVLIQSTVTAGGGLYSFNVPAGSYTLEVVLPLNFVFSPQDVGGDDTIDSDVDVVTGRTANGIINIAVDQTDNTWDAGIMQDQIFDLLIDKTFFNLSPLPVDAGDQIGWLICVTNPNAFDIDNITITDVIDTDTQSLISGSIQYGIGSVCPASPPVAGNYDIAGPFALADTNSISAPIGTLGAGQVGILYFRVTILDPGVAYSPPGATAGVLGMSTLFLPLGWLVAANRRRMRWLLMVMLALALTLSGAPLQAEQPPSDPQPSPAQDQGGQWVHYEINEENAGLTGTWQPVAFSGASGGSYLLSADRTAAATLTFTGTKLRLRYISLWDSAIASVVVDNQLVTTLSEYSADSQTRVLVTDEISISAGSHTLTIQNTGNSANPNATTPVLALDAVEVWVPAGGDEDDQSTSTLTGIVWSDTNGDGQFGPNDLLLAGVTVFLYRDAGANDILVAQDVTDATGRYTFNNLPPASYWVVVYLESLPPGIDRRSVVWSPVDVTVPYQGDLIIPRSGYEVVQGNLGGVVYADLDRNGAIGTNDQPIGGVSIALYVDNGNRIFDNDGSDYLIDTQTSSGNGAYHFGNLAPNVYWVIVDTDNLPPTVAQNQTWNPIWVRSPRVTQFDVLLVPAEPAHALSGTAWLDMDFNHQISAIDVPLEGLPILLYRDNGNSVFEPDVDDLLTDTKISAVNGSYRFDSLPEGTYWIIPDFENLPPTVLEGQLWLPFWVRVPAIATTDFLLLPAPPEALYPTGPGVLQGHVFNDDNGNRNRDVGRESGIRNSLVSLYYDNGDGVFDRNTDIEVARQQIGIDGLYSFEGLGEGTFWVYLHEDSLPPRYMDTVGYGNHGEQNPAQFVIASLPTVETHFEMIGPDFAYALDTDLDGSPDGREGAGDRDNDNIPNYLDGFDPSGVIYALDGDGNGYALAGVQVRLVYEQSPGIFVEADTIQPNPQTTGANGAYRFDINVTSPGGNGVPNNGTARNFFLQIVTLPDPLLYSFPSVVWPPQAGPISPTSDPTSGQVVSFSNPPNADDGSSGHRYYLSFRLEQGDADVVNNHVPIDTGDVLVAPTVDNQACVRIGAGTPICDSSAVALNTEIDFTVIPNDSRTLGPGDSTTYAHILENTGTQSDRYIIRFNGGNQGWTQTLTVRTTGGTTLATLSPGQTFTTSAIAPGGQLQLNHNLTVATGAGAGAVDTTTTTVTSLEAQQNGIALSRTVTDVTIVEAGCITGRVFSDTNQNGIHDIGEGLTGIRLFVLQGTTVINQATTTTDGLYNVNVAAGTYTVQIDSGSLPAGTVIFINPATGSQSVNVVVGSTCTQANFSLNIIDPAVTKFGSVAQALPGETVVFTIQVSNPSTSSTVTNVTVSDALNGYLTFVAAGTTQGTFSYTPGTNTVLFQLGSLAPGATANLSITTTVSTSVPRPSTITNTATMNYAEGGPETSLPVSITIPGESEDEEDDGSTGGGSSGSGNDFGTGGPDVVGFGQQAGGGPDTLPVTGYHPWPTKSYTLAATTKLSPEGRLFMVVVGILAIIAAAGMWYAYNNSELVYQWLKDKPEWTGKAFGAVLILLLLLGGVSLLFTGNDMAGVVDFDKFFGLKDKPDQLADNQDGDDNLISSDWSGGGDPAFLPLPTDNTRRVVIPALNLATELVSAPIIGNTWDVSHFFNEVAHLEGTASPGTTGNTVIAGHVTTSRGLGPFRDLQNITEGSLVIVKEYDTEYTYLVTEVLEVVPTAIHVTDPTDEATLTLISCANWNQHLGTYTKRIVVRAKLDKWRILSDDYSNYQDTLGELSRYEVGKTSVVDMKGTWEEIHSYHTSNSSYFYSADADAELTIGFYGDKFRLHYVSFNNFGIFDVYLDGKRIMTIDGFSPYSGFAATNIYQTTMGRHTLRIVNTGTKSDKSSDVVIGIDAIDVWQ